MDSFRIAFVGNMYCVDCYSCIIIYKAIQRIAISCFRFAGSLCNSDFDPKRI